MVSLLREIVSECAYTAITDPWSAAEQESHIAALSNREAVQIAEDRNRNLIGYQVLELWAPSLASMAHVAQIGTFVRPEWRGYGVGRTLFRHTHNFAVAHGYRKFVIQIRSNNAAAQTFYRKLGFHECGRMMRQVRIGDIEEDEILMELFL